MDESGQSAPGPARADVRTETHRLCRAARRLVHDQEQRRRLVAAVLHDEVGQMLTALKLNLGALRAAGFSDEDRELLAESRALADELVERLRAVTLQSWPAMLDDLGLEDAVRWYADHVGGAAGCESRIEASAMPADLDPVVRDTCFEVARASLDAAGDRATSMRVRLQAESGGATVTVEHDGGALREDIVQLLRDRVESCHGELRVESLPGRGARVYARVPLDASER